MHKTCPACAALANLACHYLHCPGLGWPGVKEVEREAKAEADSVFIFGMANCN